MNSSVSEFGKDMGLMHEVVITGRKVGFTAENWGKLAHDEKIMAGVLEVLNGRAEIKQVSYLVDLDAPPMIPDGWKVESHVKGGQFKFDPAKIDGTYLSEEQKNGGCLEGNKLRKKLQGKNPYNANLLDFYLAHPELIPDSWKGKAIFFWGTIYRNADGLLYVRCLYWCGSRWNWNYYYLVDGWSGDSPAAVPSK